METGLRTLRESRDDTMAAAGGDRVQTEVIALSGDRAPGASQRAA